MSPLAHDEIDSVVGDRDSILWFQTSYLPLLLDSYSRKRHQRSTTFAAVRIKREGLDEIIKRYVDDVINNRQTGKL